MSEFGNIVQDVYRAYIEKEDFGLFRDLIIEIMKKGYYPVVFSKRPEMPTMNKIDEHRFSISLPESRLKLLSDEELRELGDTPVEYALRVIKNLHGLQGKVKE